MKVRQVIDKIDRAFGRVRIESVGETWRQPARDDRRAREAVTPGDGPAFVIETSRHPVEPIRPVHVVLDVFLARPYDLHGAVDMLRDLDGADCPVGFQPSAEAAADQMIVDDDLLDR